MSAAPVPGAPVMGAELRAVRRALADAGDDRMLQVVRYVDALPDRGGADGLVAPLRQRLRQLRPARPLRFTRLLFVPLDPAIVDAAAWRPGTARLSRSMLKPMSALVRRALPAQSDAAEQIGLATERSAADRLRAAGALIWPAAATALRAADEPPEWRANALPSALFLPIATSVAACLELAPQLDALADPAMQRIELEQGLADVVRAAENAGPHALGMLLTIVLQRFPAAEAPRKLYHRADPVLRGAAEAAQAAAWAWIEASAENLSLAEPGDAATELRRQVTWLEAMAGDAAHRKQAVALQARLRAICATGFQAALTDRLVVPLKQLDAAALTDDDAWETLEADLRGLRRVDAEVRRLGGAATQDKMLREAAAAVSARADLEPMDRLRLLELLVGSQAALHMVGK